jgi:ABC-type lipoprotein export system ATPase subunit
MADTTNNQPLYQLKELQRDFRLNHGVIHILNGLTLDIHENQWLALVGKSGSGKTTLLQLLGGLDRPTGGALLYRGEDMGRMSSRRLNALRAREFGFIFQSYHLLPELTALENAALPALRWFRNRNEVYARAQELLCSFGLEHRLSHRPAELSGGEQQRVAIARALINDPPVILADEPTGNLDENAAVQVAGILRRLRDEHNKTIIMVTHDPKIAARADKIHSLG